MSARLSAREWSVDVLRAAVGLAAGVVLLLVVPDVRVPWRAVAPGFWAGATVLAVACAAMALRRAAPLTGLLVGGLAAVVGGVLVGETHLAVLIAFTDVLFYAVLNGSARASRTICWGVGLVVAAVVVLSFVANGAHTAVQNVIGLSLLVITVLWGREVRHHRGRADAERTRAEQAERLAELDRAAAVAAERARMARDLHDVIAGQLSGIAIQSEAALTVPGADPAMLRRVLGDVRRDSVSSLAEMRTMIRLLRADGAPEPRTAPTGLDGLDALLRTAHATGLTIELDDRRPDTARLPAAVDLAAYRIVAEALTNAAKHAPGSTVRLVLRLDADQLVVTVDNDLVAGTAPGGGTGTGLLGLRERAAAVGGVVDAGPGDHGWTVRADLPVAEAR